jgi:hypothetical protein
MTQQQRKVKRSRACEEEDQPSSKRSRITNSRVESKVMAAAASPLITAPLPSLADRIMYMVDQMCDVSDAEAQTEIIEGFDLLIKKRANSRSNGAAKVQRRLQRSDNNKVKLIV